MLSRRHLSYSHSPAVSWRELKAVSPLGSSTYTPPSLPQDVTAMERNCVILGSSVHMFTLMGLLASHHRCYQTNSDPSNCTCHINKQTERNYRVYRNTSFGMSHCCVGIRRFLSRSAVLLISRDWLQGSRWPADVDKSALPWCDRRPCCG